MKDSMVSWTKQASLFVKFENVEIFLIELSLIDVLLIFYVCDQLINMISPYYKQWFKKW